MSVSDMMRVKDLQRTMLAIQAIPANLERIAAGIERLADAFEAQNVLMTEYEEDEVEEIVDDEWEGPGG